jgi:hypothetical protein
MRKPGTDLMATGVILGSTALAVAATLALARADSGETQDATAECTPLEAHWAVTHSVFVDGDGASARSAPVRWRWHTRVSSPRAAQEAVHRCRHITVVTHRSRHDAAAVFVTEEAEAVRQRLEVLIKAKGNKEH